MLTYTLFKTQNMLFSATLERASQMHTYTLFKTQSMLLSATARKGQPDADLHPVQNPRHALVSNNQDGPAICRLTSCSKSRACSCKQQPGWASQRLTYNLFKTQSMFLSATTKIGQPNAGLHPVRNSEHPPVSNRGKGQPDANLQPVQNSDHPLFSNN